MTLAIIANGGAKLLQFIGADSQSTSLAAVQRLVAQTYPGNTLLPLLLLELLYNGCYFMVVVVVVVVVILIILDLLHCTKKNTTNMQSTTGPVTRSHNNHLLNKKDSSKELYTPNFWMLVTTLLNGTRKKLCYV